MDTETLEQYIEEGFSTREISAAEGVSQTTVRYWLNKYGLRTAIYRKEDRECLWCGEPVNNLYCDNTCQANHQRQERIDSWLSGEWDGNGGKYGLSDTIRTYVLERADYTCQRCGWNEIHEILGYSPVQVEHLDGDAFNQHPNNLTVLCPNCHSLTDTFGRLNKNGTRKYRYE